MCIRDSAVTGWKCVDNSMKPMSASSTCEEWNDTKWYNYNVHGLA